MASNDLEKKPQGSSATNREGSRKKQHFPLVMFLAACTKELLLDVFIFGMTLIASLIALIPFIGPPIAGSIAMAGWLLGVGVNLIFAIIFWLWVFFRLGPARLKLLVGRLVVGTALAILIAMIPGLNVMIPEYAILVFLVYYFENENMEKESKLENQTLLERTA